MNKLSEIKLLLWDWSGTISNDRAPVYEANQRLLEKHNFPRLSLDEWRDGREGWNAGNYIAKETGLPVSQLYKEFGEIFSVVKPERGEPQPYSGAVEAFKALSASRTSEIISSHTQDHLQNEVEAYGLADSVQSVRGSVSDKVAVIRQSVQDFEIPSRQVLYIGDTVQDVRAAKEAGVKIAAVTYGYHSAELLQQENPDLIVSSLGELASRLV